MARGRPGRGRRDVVARPAFRNPGLGLGLGDSAGARHWSPSNEVALNAVVQRSGGGSGWPWPRPCLRIEGLDAEAVARVGRALSQHRVLV